MSELLERIPSFQILAAAGLAAALAALFFHYVVFGPHRVESDQKKRDVARFSGWERLIHATTLLSFVTLGVTGMIAAIGYGTRLTGWLWIVHSFAAPVFTLGVTLIVVMWARDGRFASYDLEWFRYMGGYAGIGKHKHLPAGRFNAGQKVFLWVIALLVLVVLFSGIGRMYPVFGPLGQEILYQVHRYSTLIMMIAVMSHVYLGSFANPGTLGVVVWGRVTPDWAKKHHPVWWEGLGVEKSKAPKKSGKKNTGKKKSKK
ncbi:MAG: formate dehydrogenase subunit gamma [Candidatus Hydrogenedentes bacterium]|nr:formate dehydrogenase subunit gamma [Candidatus Hydrogenedentota bacterium]